MDIKPRSDSGFFYWGKSRHLSALQYYLLKIRDQAVRYIFTVLKKNSKGYRCHPFREAVIKV